MKVSLDTTGLTVQSDGTFDLPLWLRIKCSSDERCSQNAAATVVSGFGADTARMFSRDGVTRGLLLEPPGKNLATEQDITTWGATGTPILSDAGSPNGDLETVSIEDDDAVLSEDLHDTNRFSPTIGPHVLSAWLQNIGAFQARIDVRAPGVFSQINFTGPDAAWHHEDATYGGAVSVVAGTIVTTPRTVGAEMGIARYWGMQVEADRAYPTSFMGADNATFIRQPDRLQAIGAALSSDGFFRVSLKYRPHYAQNETAVDHNLLWFDDGTRLFFRQVDQKLVLRIFGDDLTSAALVFARHAELLIVVEHTAAGRRIVVNGIETTATALPAFSVSSFAYVLGSSSGSEEGADLLLLDAQQTWWPDLIAQQDDHAGRVSRFIEQWRNKEDLGKLAQIYLRQCQDLEDAFFEIILKRCLDDAEGVQLTTIGNIVQQNRTTSDDGRFRSMIRARIAINLSHSTAEDIIKVGRILLQEYGEVFKLRDEPPAQLRVTVIDPLQSIDPDLLQTLLNEADAGGVRLLLNYTSTVKTSDKFTFSDSAGSATTGKGFGDSSGGTTDIGYLASVEE